MKLYSVKVGALVLKVRAPGPPEAALFATIQAAQLAGDMESVTDALVFDAAGRWRFRAAFSVSSLPNGG